MVDAFEDQRDRVWRYRQFAVAELAEHVLAGMRHGFEPRQAEEAASALDRVHQAEDVAEDLGVAGFAFQPHQLHIEQSPGFRSFR